MVRATVVGVIVLCACAKEPRAPEVAPAPPPPVVVSDASGAPSIGVLRHGDGTVESATPAQTVATLRANCDLATATNDNAVACFSLGQLYDTGTFVTKDAQVAMALHDRACGLGEMRACAELGVFYDDGVVVPPDAARASKYFRQACDGGNGRGCNNIILLHPERATKEDIAYVLGRWRAICDGGGDPEACMAFGDAYRIGAIVPADAKRAVALYAKACDADHPKGCNNLGAMIAMGQGAKRDDARAAELYAKACKLGSPEGCANAGIDPNTAPVQIKERTPAPAPPR